MDQLNTDHRLAPTGKRIYLFFAGAVVLLVAFFTISAYKQNFFTRVTALYFFSDNATGIKTGMAVQTLGFHIGEVADISIEPNAKVRVKITVQTDYMRFITQDSRAKLYKEGMIGDSVIEISPGNQQLRQLAYNAVLPFSRGRELTEIADQLYGEIQPVLKEAAKTLVYVNDPAGDIRQTLRHANEAALKVQSLTSQVAAQLPPILAKTDSAAQSINQSLPALLSNASLSLVNIRAATDDLKQLTTASVQDIPPALHDGRALVNGSLSIVKGVKQSWPVSTMIDSPGEQALPSDSYVQPR